MTVESTINRIAYNGTGALTPLPVSFPFPAITDLVVIETVVATGVETLKVLNTDYEVTGFPDALQHYINGGTVTPLLAFPVTVTWAIYRDPEQIQGADLVENDNLPAESVEAEFDYVTMLIQRLSDRADRTVHQPDGDSAAMTVLPTALLRASKYLSFDSNGNPQAVDPATTAVGTMIIPTGGTTSRLLADVVSYPLRLRDHGAVGNGSTDDATAIQALVTAGIKKLTGEGLTYKVNSPLTGVVSGQVFEDMTLDFSSMPAQVGQDICIFVTGSKGSAVALTANSATDDLTIQVGDTSTFAIDQWVWLESTAVWSAATNTIFGQYGKIKTVDSSTQVTLYQGVVVPFNTADSATISPVTPVQGVKFKNVKLLGAVGTDQVGIWYDYALDCVDEDVVIEGMENTGIAWWRCINMRGSATVRKATGANAYGYGIYSGCYGCRVIGGHGDYQRHYVTVGDNDGINLHTLATNNTITNARSAGLDSHPSSMHTTFAHNEISLAGSNTGEGITVQGLIHTVEGNTIYGIGDAGVGILLQPLVTYSGLSAQYSAINNRIHFRDTTTGTTVGIQAQVQVTNGTNFLQLDISGNKFYGGANATTCYQIYIQAVKVSSLIKRLTLHGNISVDSSKTYGCYIRAEGASALIQFITCTANQFKASSTYAIIFQCSGASATIDWGTITGNTFSGGSTASIGFLAPGAGSSINEFAEGNNAFSAGGLLYNFSGTVTGMKLGSARFATPAPVTDAAYTLVQTTNTFIFNRAGTVTVTFPAAAAFPGRELMFKTIQAQAVISNASDVQPATSVTLGTAILPATDGAWCLLKSNGTDWVVMQQGT